MAAAGSGCAWRISPGTRSVSATRTTAPAAAGAATVVDHRTPHNGDEALLYDWDNLQSMTKACHDRKTAARDGGFGNPRR